MDENSAENTGENEVEVIDEDEDEDEDSDVADDESTVSESSIREQKLSGSKKTGSAQKSKVKSNVNVNEVLNDFYKLKAKYETDYYEKYIKPIISSKNLSKSEKRLEYQKLPKAECINCKRNVGSIFTIKKNPEEYCRIFIAKCGDLNDPCPLDINFDYTCRDELGKEVSIQEKDINAIKNKIIIDKNEMMFGYIDQEKAIDRFNVDTTELKEVSEMAGYIMEINIEINDNPVKKELIQTNEAKLGTEFLLPFKEMIKTFDQTGDTEVLNKAVKFYLDEMAPLAKTIRELKYEVSYVDFLEKKNNDDPSEKGDLYILVQKKNSLHNLEYTLYGNDELNSYTKGVSDFISKDEKNVAKDVNESESMSKTRKNLDKSRRLEVHKKTRKLRPDIIEFVDDSEEAEQEQEQEQEQVQGNKPINLRKKLVLQNATEAMQESQQKLISESKPYSVKPNTNIYESVEGNIMPHKKSNGGVMWTNENGDMNMMYQNIWDHLSSEYKEALSQDDVWMKKSLDHFVSYNKLRAENKVPYISSRKFVHPDGLLLPPRKVGDSNSEYDYGNAVYNKLLNTGQKRQGIWLSFLPKSADGSYQPYLSAIADILGNKLKFTKI